MALTERVRNMINILYCTSSKMLSSLYIKADFRPVSSFCLHLAKFLLSREHLLDSGSHQARPEVPSVAHTANISFR